MGWNVLKDGGPRLISGESRNDKISDWNEPHVLSRSISVVFGAHPDADLLSERHVQVTPATPPPVPPIVMPFTLSCVKELSVFLPPQMGL